MSTTPPKPVPSPSTSTRAPNTSTPTASVPTTFGLPDLERVLRRSLSVQQAAVVRAPLAPAVVVAGAGSGKTATMVARVVDLVARGEVAADRVLGLTFTSKAADELAGRVRAALRSLALAGRLPGHEQGADLEPTVSTYHAYAGRLVRDHALRIGREPTARLITPATSWQLAARVVGGWDGPMDTLDLAETTVVRHVLALAGELSEHLVTPDAVRAEGARLRAALASAESPLAASREAVACQQAREQLLPLVEAYARAKRERDLLDFGDVVALAAQLARERPEVAEAERAAYAVVLLDEYQDTGTAQEVLLTSLFGPVARGVTAVEPVAARHPVMAVGDPCQSIYGWRGASAGTLRRFGTRFGGADGALQLGLSTTYRNGGPVLMLANALSKPLRTEGLSVAELSAAPGRERVGEVVCALLEDDLTEATWVAEQVRGALVALGEPGPEQGRWARAAVLCRKRSMFPLLRRAFETLEVPVEVVGLGGLLDVPEVADLLATLRVLDDPDADASLLRLLAGPRWSLGPRDLVALGAAARELGGRQDRPGDPLDAVVEGVQPDRSASLVDALDAFDPDRALERGDFSAAGARRLGRLAGELRALRRRLDQPLPDLVADVERTLGLDVEVVTRPGTDDPAAARADLDAFADAAATFSGDAAQDGSGSAALTAFLAFLEAAESEEHGLDTGPVSGADTVKLMTVHAAKGLEWPVVAVPGLSGGVRSKVFPSAPRGGSWLRVASLLPFPLRGDAADLPRLDGLEGSDVKRFAEAMATRHALEERRLAYVAVTRAETTLLCSGYHWGAPTRPLGPSLFLDLARQACEQGAGRVDRWCEAPADNPRTDRTATVAWPQTEPRASAGTRAAADRVRSLVLDGPGAWEPELPLRPEAAARVQAWDQDLERLHEEQQQRRQGSGQAVLPGHLSVSALVELTRDPGALARRLRRPLPRRPSPVARRGTAFHAWLEREVFGSPQLLDDDELPGSADDGAVDDTALVALQAAFRASAWWGQNPHQVEVPFEMALAGLALRGRMDAVYRASDEAGVHDEVVDWKTGAVPTGAAARASAVQLAAYRLAWHRLSGTPLDQVSAAFHYVAAGLTVRPADLLDADELAAVITSVEVEGTRG